MYSLNFYKYIFNLINIFRFQFNNQILIYFSKSNSFNPLFIKFIIKINIKKLLKSEKY